MNVSSHRLSNSTYSSFLTAYLYIYIYRYMIQLYSHVFIVVSFTINSLSRSSLFLEAVRASRKVDVEDEESSRSHGIRTTTVTKPSGKIDSAVGRQPTRMIPGR